MYVSYSLVYGLAAWLSLIFMRWLLRYQAGLLPVRQGDSPKDKDERKIVYQLLPPLLCLTALALFLWYAVWQWHLQAWYLLPTMLILTIFVSLVAQKLALNYQAFYQVVGLTVFINLLVFLGFSLSIGFGYPRQERAYYIAQWVQENTDSEDIIGTWNSGIIAYFTTRPVINLDGVVNNSIYDYKVTHQTNNIPGLMPYFKVRRIRYLTDYEAFNLADPAVWGLRRVYQSAEHDFHIYEIIEDR